MLIGCLIYVDIANAARGGGGRGKGRGGGRKGYGSRMPVLIQHRNPASASYYNHKDVSIQIRGVNNFISSQVRKLVFITF